MWVNNICSTLMFTFVLHRCSYGARSCQGLYLCCSNWTDRYSDKNRYWGEFRFSPYRMRSIDRFDCWTRYSLTFFFWFGELCLPREPCSSAEDWRWRSSVVSPALKKSYNVRLNSRCHKHNFIGSNNIQTISYYYWLYWFNDTIRYDTREEFNVDSKAE